jgi:hypothetical protein
VRGSEGSEHRAGEGRRNAAAKVRDLRRGRVRQRDSERRRRAKGFGVSARGI